MERPRKASDLNIQTVGDEVLVHHPSAEKVHILNRTAGHILELCDGARTEQDIVDALCRETGAEHATVAKDVAQLIRDFSGLGLVS